MTFSENDIRVALLGYGLGGRSFHAPIISATPGLRLAVIVTANPERARQAGAEHPGVRVIASADEAWSHAGEFDLVVISTPNRTHVPLALAAIRADRNVVIDKPMAATPGEARAVVEEARQRKLMLTVYQNRRWDGDFLTVRRLLDEEALGRVHRFESRFERWRPEPKPGWRESSAPEDAGGLLYDIGTHLIDQALVLFGPVTDVYAEIARVRANVQVDDDVFVALTHASGVRSHLWTSVLAASHGPRFRMLGTAAAYTKHGIDVQEDALRHGKRPGEAAWGIEPAEQWGTLEHSGGSRRVRTEAGAYQRFYEGVVSSIRTGAPPPVDPADAIATLEVIAAAQRRAE